MGGRLRRRPARLGRRDRSRSTSATRSPARPSHRLDLTDGAVATSGIDIRLWRAEDGTPRHHLLDPATGEPAWTGLIGATALAPTALEAEALAKAALLSGPAGAGRWLRRHGGLTVRDDGDVVFHGAARPRPVVRRESWRVRAR